ncbi:MAG TPA: 16S rRNA (guanine(527)-N(7))-methyltransferase RsmG [Stellaceae bacterium]|nr:16S rRNA (guanine(527)-N(7))-methyltransferase RsmG [Stellaceae bacterium]
MTAEGFARLTHVSRETLARLEDYVRLLSAWNHRINLVGRSTIGDVWQRHILDSTQILHHLLSGTRTVVDLGSGAGLPGLVLAILGVPQVHLIESDRRKAVFLAEAIRLTRAPATLHARRAEDVPPFAADAITARACANLTDLLGLALPFMGPRTLCLFHKGRVVADELTDAAKDWNMLTETLPSVTDKSGCILKVEGVSRVERL